MQFCVVKRLLTFCLLIVLGIFITVGIQYSFENYVFACNTLLDRILTGIVSMAIWVFVLAGTLFILSWFYPPFGRFFFKWFNVNTDTETPTNTEDQPPTKRSRKKVDWEKYMLVVSVIGLVITSVLTAGLTAYSFGLTKQANDIAQKSLDLQNYPVQVVPNTAPIYLEKGLPPDEHNPQSEAGGWFNFSIIVRSPYGGSLSVKVLNFTTGDYDYLLPDPMNKTWCSIEGSYEYSNHDQVIDSGLIQKDYSIPLRLYFYPDFNKLKGTGTSSEFLAVGTLYLQATFVDGLGNPVPKGFSEAVIANVVMPA